MRAEVDCAAMTTTVLLNHDLDPNEHRILGGRGADIILTSSGDVTLGEGNFFRIIVAEDATILGRIAVADWPIGSAIDLQFIGGVTIANGFLGGDGFAGIITPNGTDIVAITGAVARLVRAPDDWRFENSGSNLTLSSAAPLPDCIGGNPGLYTGDKAAAEGHQHPLIPTAVIPPASVESTLFPAPVPNPLYRGEAIGLLQHGEGGASLTATSGISTWYVGTAPGQLFVRDATGDATILAQDGDFIGYWMPGLEPDSPSRTHLGLYKVIDCGHHVVPTPGHPETPMVVTTVPIIARTTSANTPAWLCRGSIWSIVATGGAEYAGYSFTLATEDTVVVDATLLDFTATAGYTPTVAHELLTGPQLTSEHASQNTVVTSATGIGDIDMEGFETIVGFPALAVLPAGRWGFAHEHIWLDMLYPGSPGSTTTLRWRILKEPGAIELFTAESSPITSIAPIAMSFEYDDVGHTLSPTDRLVAIPSLHTNSTTPVVLYLSYGGATWATRITVPFALPIAGASDGTHQHLAQRDQDVASTDPEKADPCHPADAVGAGRLHRNIGTGVVSSVGILTLPDDASQCRVLLSTDITQIRGIVTTRFLDGDPIMVDFPDASTSVKAHLVDRGDVSSFPDAAPIALQTAGGSASGAMLSSPTTVWLWYDLARTCWRFDRKSSTS
jgi:hypothetical protein